MSAAKNHTRMMGKVFALQQYIRAVRNTTIREICDDLQFSKRSTALYIEALILEEKVVLVYTKRSEPNTYSLGRDTSDFDIDRPAFAPYESMRKPVKKADSRIVIIKSVLAKYKFIPRGEFETYLFGEAKYQTDISRILAAGYADCVGGA